MKKYCKCDFCGSEIDFQSVLNNMTFAGYICPICGNELFINVEDAVIVYEREDGDTE